MISFCKTPKSEREKNDPYQLENHPRKEDEKVGHFHTSPQNILIKIKGNPILKRPKPIETPTKFKNKNKYYEYYNDFGAHHFFSAMSIKGPPQVS